MAPTFKRIFAHKGIFLPYRARPGDRNRPVARRGFRLIELIREGLYVVQSVANDKMYVVKTVRRVNDKWASETTKDEFTHDTPHDLRVSTVVNAEVQLPRQLHFPHIAFYQQVDESRWELYFE